MILTENGYGKGYETLLPAQTVGLPHVKKHDLCEAN